MGPCTNPPRAVSPYPTGPPTDHMETTDEYTDRIHSHREQKDEFFENHPRSPIPTEERDAFDGLSYFPVDPDYRFEAALDRHDDPERITVETTQDGQQTYEDVGAFTVALGGEQITLHAYRPADGENRLWVPFRDETSGEETYPAGRYLDLEDPDDRTADDAWVVDFNRAYSPFCAYADAYECPLVPVDNWLSVPIRAGEKTPDL